MTESDLLPQAYHLLLVMALSSARLLAIFVVMPVLSDQMVPGMARNAVVIALALVVAPVVAATMPAHGDLALSAFLLVLVKEGMLGMLIGFVGAAPFWIAENIGNFIDNQRGATMGAVFAPLTGSEDSPIGVLLLQVAVALFFVGGGVLVYLGAIYSSYSVWPVFSPMPHMSPSFSISFLAFADQMLRTTIVLASPAILIMLLVTLGLGIISRTVPQLNVFFLAMPVKSAVGIFFLVLYLSYLIDVLEAEMKSDVIGFLRGILV